MYVCVRVCAAREEVVCMSEKIPVTYRFLSQLGCPDELGDRRKCEHATREALRAGGKVVIDRTNIDEHQRLHWLRIARQCRVPGLILSLPLPIIAKPSTVSWLVG